MHLDDDDRASVAESYGVNPQSGYFAAGMVVGNITVSVAFGAATGGLGGATCATRAASVARVIGGAMKGAMIAGEAVEVGGAALEYAETGEWSMRQTMALVGLAGSVGGHALGKFFAPKCFVEGTEVAVEGDGGLAGKPIEEIEVGDLVWARCDVTGEEGFKPVVTLFRNDTDSLVHVTYTASGVGASPASGGTLPALIGGDADATHTLTGTAEHPFWSVTRGAWVEMGALQSRETLLLAGGHTATITSVRTERLATPVAVYNFEVADWHTYHVGTPTGWVWVHNTCKFKGGRFDSLGSSRRIHRHHMPADGAMHVTTRGEGPAIQMLAKDHRLTSSYGNPTYVRRMEEMLNNDQWREAFAMEIRDVRRVAREVGAPRRYNAAIREMMAYARKIGIPNL